jgi:hypothetical protein
MSIPARVEATPECWASQSDLQTKSVHIYHVSLACFLHDETLETELALQDVVLEVRVLADLRVVDLVVAAHDTTSSGANSVGKGPEVQLVKCLVVQVRAESIDVAEVFELAGLAEVLLFVHDVVLGASDNTGILNTADGVGNSNPRQHRVWRETFPVTLNVC